MRHILKWIYLDGKIINQKSALIPALNGGYQYGYGVFTTLKVREGFPLFLSRHLARLKSNADDIGLPLRSDSKKAIMEVIAKNRLKDGGLRITISKNSPPGSLTIIHAFTTNLPVQKVDVITIPDPRDIYKTIKTTYRLPHLMAQKYAENKGAQDTLFTAGKFLVESTYANIIACSNNQIITPPLGSKGFNGIIRQILMENLPVQEKNIPSGTLDPMILVNSLGLRVVNSIDSRVLRQNKEFTNLIADALDKYEKSYIRSKKFNEN